MPVIRGDLGRKHDAWRIAGSGRKIQQVNEWKEADAFPLDWEEQLGKPFLQYAKEKVFDFYLCPGEGCSHLI